MADLADFYPASQQVPQNVNGTQPVTPRGVPAAGAAGGSGSPALWALGIIGLSLLLLHLE